MSAKYEFGQKGEKRDLYAELLLASQECRIRYDLLQKLIKDFPDTVSAGYLRGKLENELSQYRDEVSHLMHLLGA